MWDLQPTLNLQRGQHILQDLQDHPMSYVLQVINGIGSYRRHVEVIEEEVQSMERNISRNVVPPAYIEPPKRPSQTESHVCVLMGALKVATCYRMWHILKQSFQKRKGQAKRTQLGLLQT